MEKRRNRGWGGEEEEEEEEYHSCRGGGREGKSLQTPVPPVDMQVGKGCFKDRSGEQQSSLLFLTEQNPQSQEHPH